MVTVVLFFYYIYLYLNNDLLNVYSYRSSLFMCALVYCVCGQCIRILCNMYMFLGIFIVRT